MSIRPSAPCSRIVGACTCGGTHGGSACPCSAPIASPRPLKASSSQASSPPRDVEAPGRPVFDDSGGMEEETMDICTRFEEWENWDCETPLWKHAVAGSCAGVTEHICMYPLDTVKTHMQALRPSGGQARLTDVLRDIIRENGGRGFMRGCTAIATGCIPAHIAMFTSYEFAKQRLLVSDEHQPIRAAICGATSNICHDVILTPMDMVKQRMQLGRYNGVGDCLRSVLRREGLGALFRSMPTTMVMNVPFGSVFVSTNESIKVSLGLNTPSSSSSSRKRLLWYFAAAGTSGVVASCVTQPLDVIKTRLQTQDCLVTDTSSASTAPPSSRSSSASAAAASHKGSPAGAAVAGDGGNARLAAECEAAVGEEALVRKRPKYAGFMSAVTTIVREEGVRALYRGLLPRVVHAAPAAALCWGTYETVKSHL